MSQNIQYLKKLNYSEAQIKALTETRKIGALVKALKAGDKPAETRVWKDHRKRREAQKAKAAGKKVVPPAGKPKAAAPTGAPKVTRPAPKKKVTRKAAPKKAAPKKTTKKAAPKKTAKKTASKGPYPSKETRKRVFRRSKALTRTNRNLPQTASGGAMVKSKGNLPAKRASMMDRWLGPGRAKKPPNPYRHKGKIGLAAAAGTAALTYWATRDKKKEKPSKLTDETGGRQAPSLHPDRMAGMKKRKQAPAPAKAVAKKTPPKRKTVVKGSRKAVKGSRMAVNVHRPSKRLAAGPDRGPKKGITGGEAAVAGGITALAAKVPGIHKTADSIAGFLGKNLKSLGMAAMAAGSVYAIAKSLAAHRRRETQPVMKGMRKGMEYLKGAKRKSTVTGRSYKRSRLAA